MCGSRMSITFVSLTLLMISCTVTATFPQKPAPDTAAATSIAATGTLPRETKFSPLQDISVVQRRLATIPDGGELLSVLFGPDGANVACVFKVGKKVRVMIDDWVGPVFEEVSDLIASPRGGAFAYSAKDGEKEWVVLNRERGEAYDWVYGPPRFSPDGKSLAYTARNGKRCFVILDGKKIAEWEHAKYPIFSPDGQRLAYVVTMGEHWFVVVGEKRYRPFDYVSDRSLVFSPDGSRVAYIARKAEKEFVVIDEQPGEAFNGILFPQFSADGTSIAYIAGSQANRPMVVVDGKKQKEYDYISDLVWGPHGKVAYFAAEDHVRLLVEGDRERRIGCLGREAFTSVMSLTFSPDGQRIAYRVSFGHEKETMGPIYDLAGKMTGYRRGEGVRHAVVIGETIGPRFDWTGAPVFSPDGFMVAYEASEGDHWFVVCGDKRSEVVDLTWRPQFSRDGKKVGFGALKGRELWWMVLELD